ncbi:hypothetical protein RT717_21740 [Imperialibacter roseus]|uniref:VWFA domain-containing protein n=1 Tax=Imperialibacter roseus TaxID=1324217 RepID=A0ABZ0IKZ9_9BACT|nr:hypothetical protein [Imperialibacter roseus]WOK05702.1 hypothetical protein RT717_21740 [Imperialibacter roseus]
MHLLFLLGFLSLQNRIDEPPIKFVIESNKTTVIEGECFILTAYLIFPSDSIGFSLPPNFSQQVSELRSKMKQENYFYHENLKPEPFFEDLLINGKKYRRFELTEIAACPCTDDDITIRSHKLTLLKDKTFETELESQPLNIRVNAIDQNLQDSLYINYFYKMVGVFDLYEKIENEKKSYTVGDTIDFTLRVYGEGISFPVDLNIKNSDDWIVETRGITQKDTVRSGKMRMFKTFNLKLIPLKPSAGFAFSDLFSWTYFSLAENKLVVLAPKTVVEIDNNISYDPPEPKKRKPISTAIAMDISESMQIIDYYPNRRYKAFEVTNILRNKNCAIPVLYFSGEVFNVDRCNLLDVKIPDKMRKGTALGDAVWQALKLLEGGQGERNIILIGDGDETAGTVPAMKIAKLANEMGVKIHTVGIGYSDSVPIPVTLNQKVDTVYLDNTFRDDLFKAVSRASGGAYYWIDKYVDPRLTLQDLVQTIK